MTEEGSDTSIQDAAADGVFAPAPAAGSGRVTGLWTGFVIGWLLVLIVVGGMLARERLEPLRLALALLGLATLAALYLWVTMREALGPSDLASGAPDGRSLRRRLALLGAMTLLVIALVALLPAAGTWWLVQHVIIAAGLSLPARLASGLIGASIASTIGTAWAVRGRPDPMLLILVAFGAAAVAIRQLTINVAQLRAAREALARAAVDRERLRFARDLHDLLGHTMSLIILKSELAGRLLPASPARAAVEIGDVERAARDALGQARAAAAGYRRPALRQELEAARELLAAADIDVEVLDSSESVGSELDGLIAWAVREGVTNVIRHSRARRCEIRVGRLEDRIKLAVTDDGRGTPAVFPAPGHGLAGLAERAAAHGGVVQAGPRAAGGFRLLLIVPSPEKDEP